MYDEMLGEMKDKLDRKEFFMQNKERKWLEIEKILEEYVEEDDELRDKLLELRLNVTASSAKKITNVVCENDKLKVQLDNAHEEIGRLRKQLLTIGMGSMKTDANGRLMTHSPKAATLPLNFDVDPDDLLDEIDDEEEDNENQEGGGEMTYEDDNDFQGRKSKVANSKRRNSSKFLPPPM